MAKILTPENLGRYLIKVQGELSQAQFAQSRGISRSALRSVANHKYNPSPSVLQKLGLERVYRVIAPVAITHPASVKPAAKKSARRVVKR